MDHLIWVGNALLPREIVYGAAVMVVLAVLALIGGIGALIDAIENKRRKH